MKRLVLILMTLLCVIAVKVSAIDVQVKMNTQTKFMTLVNKESSQPVDVGTPAEVSGASTYSFSAPAGTYTLTGYASDNTTINGTIDLVVTEAESLFEIFTITAYASNSGWTLETDYTINVTAVSREGDNLHSTLGASTTSGRGAFLVYKGSTFFLDYVPSATRVAQGYMTSYLSKTVTFSSTASTEICKGYTWTASVPEGADFFIGRKTSHFVPFIKVEPQSIAIENGNKIYSYTLADKQQYNFRASKQDGLTYGGVFNMSGDPTKVPTLAFTDADFAAHDPHTINHNPKSNQSYETGDIFLRANEKGYINMALNETRDMLAMRTWQLTNSSTANYFIEPSFHYTVLNTSGQPDNSVLTFDRYQTDQDPWVKMQAVGEGTAIVLVTYDAIDLCSYSGATKTPYMGGEFWGAIWPENTGVYVVTVGPDAADIDPNMVINEAYNEQTLKNSGKYVDAEHDVFYYLDTQEGFTYTFTPTGVASVEIAYPTIGAQSVSFSGFTTQGITKNQDDSYSVLLKQGRQILRLTNSQGQSVYQVLTAKPCQRTITNGTRPDSKIFQPGDKINIQYSGLFHPANKLSGIYNMSAYVTYNGLPNGQELILTPSQYQFGGSESAQKITTAISANYDVNENPVLKMTQGVLQVKGYGDPIGNHRILNKTTGRNPNFTAMAHLTYFGALPDIEVPLTPIKYFTVIPDLSVAGATLILKDASGNTLQAADDGNLHPTYGTYTYTANSAGYKNAHGTINITDDSEDQITLAVTMQTIPQNGWDGTTLTEPAIQDGAYQIGTGAELAWFANEVSVNKNLAINAQLTADINLCGFDWTTIGLNSASVSYKGTFDGQNHTISELYINSASKYQGLFGYTNQAKIKNLTVEGSVVSTSDYVGGISAYAQNTVIENCTNNVSLSGNQYVGGIAGYARQATTIDRCTNQAAVSAAIGTCAGILSGNTMGAATITNCLNSGSVNAPDNVATIIARPTNTSTVQYCLNVGTLTSQGANTGNVQATSTSPSNSANNYVLVHYNYGADNEIIATIEQLASGEIAAALGEAWGQKLGADAHPVIGGNKVYTTDDGYANLNDYDLNILTFEDSDYKGSGQGQSTGQPNWSSLIDSPQYQGPLLYGPSGQGSDVSYYYWSDQGNTMLAHEFPRNWDSYCYWGGGHGVSHYGASDLETYNGYFAQLTVYNSNAQSLVNNGAGHGGSDNFCVHYGYHDNSGYSAQEVPYLYFSDGMPRVIDHMYVNNTCYNIACYLDGNNMTPSISETDWVKIVATGFNADGEESGSAEIYLCNGPENIIMDWTKFDLSSLGPVIMVKFNILGSSDNGFGFSQPAYFAYDDVAVRVPSVIVTDGKALVSYNEPITQGALTDVFNRLAHKQYASLDLTATTLASTLTSDDFAAKMPQNVLAQLPATAAISGNNLVCNGQCTNLMLTDRTDFTPQADFVAQTATYTHTDLDDTGWYSAVLPYAFTLPEGVEAIGDPVIEGSTITFNKLQGTIEANTPFLYRTAAGSVTYEASNVSISATSLPAGGTFKGTFKRIPAGEATNLIILNPQGTAFAVATENASIPAFRAYIEASAGASAFSIVVNDDLTDISSAANTPSAASKTNVYTVDGVLLRTDVETSNALQGLPKGLYLVGGKIVKK